MSNELKQIRGQIRQIAKELLPEVLSSELYAHVEKRLLLEITKRLNEIDNRQKEMTSYIIRNQQNPIVK